LKDSNISKDEFLQLIEQYLEGKLPLDKVKDIISYYESYQVNNKWLEEFGSENIVKNRMLLNIHEFIQAEESKQTKRIVIFKRPVFRYAVAAAVLLFVFFNLYLDSPSSSKTNQVSTLNSTIKIGTDKATLTTEDGTNIVLEKGETYISNNVVSDGKELVYSQGNQSKSEVVYNYLTIPRGGQFLLKLSDGTRVWLNSESKLKYPVSFNQGESREVELLYGEAYFDVSVSSKNGGTKFTVVHELQEIEVLGTEFNVKAYKDEDNIFTTLVEGKIVLNIENRQAELDPNQQFILNVTNKSTVVISKIDVYSEIAWKRGLFSFKDKPLKDIMKVLSRWYDVDVVFEDKTLEDVRFKGVLNKNQNIEEILKLIQNTNFINAYDIKDNKIILKN
jgi:hypothetical protein